jgi:hypothetical protein
MRGRAGDMVFEMRRAESVRASRKGRKRSSREVEVKHRAIGEQYAMGE